MPHGLTASLRNHTLKDYETRVLRGLVRVQGIAQGIKGLQQKSEDWSLNPQHPWKFWAGIQPHAILALGRWEGGIPRTS